jgi:acyl carrier protein
LEILGRKDFQTKIRSFRVDVGEVEAVLAVHPKVREVTVIARNDPAGDTRLIAYLVPHSLPSPTITSLRDFLNQRLPDYMIPSAFVSLDKLPLLPTGKVDRRALPEPGNRRPNLDGLFVAPRTTVETRLSQIWAAVLGVEGVGIHDNFFDLGGHSLAATRVVSQILKTFQLELPLQSLFQSPTVAEMAVVIMERQGKKLDEQELNRMLAELESLSGNEEWRL